MRGRVGGEQRARQGTDTVVFNILNVLNAIIALLVLNALNLLIALTVLIILMFLMSSFVNVLFHCSHYSQCVDCSHCSHRASGHPGTWAPTQQPAPSPQQPIFVYIVSLPNSQVLGASPRFWATHLTSSLIINFL